jgi:hypothetical protein
MLCVCKKASRGVCVCDNVCPMPVCVQPTTGKTKETKKEETRRSMMIDDAICQTCINFKNLP